MEKVMQKQNRATVFAHYDKNNIIQDYVIYYLKELKRVSEIIIFVSDSSLNKTEINKISSIANTVIAKPHGEYDFGSYKIGFDYLEKNNILNSLDELIFANDSCFGPITDIEKIWENMNNKPCDFWGNSFNLSGNLLHIQSYFLVFKKQVFTSEIFKNFIHNITKQNSKDDIIKKYEIGLSQILITNGFRPNVYINYGKDITGQLIFIKQISPFLKINLAKKIYLPIYKIILKFLWKKFKIYYPLNLILMSLKSNKNPKQFNYNSKIIRRIFFRFHLKERKLYILGHWFCW